MSDRDVLPDNVKPINYSLSLHNLDLDGSWTYQGSVQITANIKSATDTIVVNAHELDLKSAEISGGKSSKITYDGAAQRATLHFPEVIVANKNAVLDIAFSGTINNKMTGFYRSKYKPVVTPSKSVPVEGEHHLMFSTQFESCDARRAFPCFDEPNLKATFDVSIEIPDDQVALSNMPERSTRPTENGRKVVCFERTPVMSTYLLAWAFGDFEYVEEFTKRKYSGKNLPVRVYTTRGLKDQGHLGVSVCHQVVDYFSEIFRIDYPLPKIDLIAVHEFSHGAMENWGLITYRTTAILFDEETSDKKYLNRVAYVVAHELAHQWFGNLVTMSWWNELWLNEGFATWVGWLAIDHLYPSHQVWSQFVTEAVQTAQNLDSLRASHPIEVPVRDALEVEQIFDAISYLKGSSVIRMLSAHLGVKVFLKGVHSYLKKHSYGNATTNDLWAALSEASGKDVNTFMDPWIRKIGFPVLTVAEEPGQIGIRQDRFLSTGDVEAVDNETLWWIPLGLNSAQQTQESSSTQALISKEETLPKVDESFYKLNADSVAFIRINYPPARLAKLGAEKNKLSVEDRIGLVADSAAMATAGLGTTPALLGLLEHFQDESNFAVWSQIVSSLANVRSIFADNEAIANGLKAFTLRLVESATDKFGWEYPPNENYLPGQLRALLISTAGGAGHQKTIAEAKRQFAALISGDVKAVHPNLRLSIFRIVIAEGGDAEYRAVKQQYTDSKSFDGKETCLLSLGQVHSTNLIEDFLDFQFADSVAIQDVHTGSVSLAMNAKARDTLWLYVKENWESVSKKLSSNPVVMDRYLKTCLSKFSNHKTQEDIAAFFKEKDTKGYDRGLVQVSDSIRANANYKNRDGQLVLEWLKSHDHV